MIISYQAITGNNNGSDTKCLVFAIISYQAITGNNNGSDTKCLVFAIISYQAITGNNNLTGQKQGNHRLYHTKR